VTEDNRDITTCILWHQQEYKGIWLCVHHEGVWMSEVIPQFIRNIAITWRCAVSFTFNSLGTDCQLKKG